MILKDLCLFHIFYFLPFRRKLTNCWHFLLILECLPMLASFPLQRLCCCWLSAVAGLPTSTVIPVASVTPLTPNNVAGEPAVDGIHGFASIPALAYSVSGIPAVSLIPTVAGIPANVHVRDVVSLHLFCQYSFCYWLLRRRTCCCWHPTVASIVIASITLLQVHCCFWHSCCCWHPICRWVNAVFLRTLLLLLHGYWIPYRFWPPCWLLTSMLLLVPFYHGVPCYCWHSRCCQT
jgi:hypothetical protein